ncbi:MAG: 2-succinyl-5-enolpyruvyl-6-hydroxy-3-cyclohexene-1-carboxylic-acid synthase [Verrucomicrobiaceae bacterium]|nr:2-succinyl-5-enolpyruvyl-6-hydroxy-3-cyclohexene-1-carboxylic-acid synthase [Verrucomicrobiaceae bacterium]
MIAQSVLQACVNLGVREFVVCAGSRNSDLVHGLLQHRDQVELYSFFEERSAAFFALGRTLSQPYPVAIITTSGTAAAELLPAVIEAHYQERPLVMITADRPIRYRGSGAPQAIEQSELFSVYAETYDLESDDDVRSFGAATDEVRSPLHLNVCLEEPGKEIPEIHLKWTDRHRPAPNHQQASDFLALERFLEKPTPLLVIAGCLTPDPKLVATLASLNAPILADATSGLHAEPSLAHLILRGGDRTAQQLELGKVLRLGGVPSFRFWRDLETQANIDVLSLSNRPFSGLACHSMLFEYAPGCFEASSQNTLTDWKEIEAAQAAHLERLLSQYPHSEPAQLRALLTYIPIDAQLFVGNSLPIRELSLVAARKLPWPVYANRGANGIDGNLATSFGLAAGQEQGETWGLFGDLTTLYDLAAPGLLSELPHTQTRTVVINNGGGKIFRRLPNFQGIAPNDTAIIENHHQFDFQSWAQAWGIDYHLIQANGLAESLSCQHAILEIRPDENQTEAFWADYLQN